MQIVDDGVFGADRDVAHQAHLGVETGTVDRADGRDFSEIVDQRADIDAAVLVGVLVGPIIQVLFLQFEAFRIGIHHEFVARSGEDQDFGFSGSAPDWS